MSGRRSVLKVINSFITLTVVFFLSICGVYAGYALWDNNQVYQAAEDVQLKMKSLKPVVSEEDGPTFEELKAVNQDVCAWITMDGTKIDFPVVRGDTNLTYINKDVFGNFALAGSIFLDCRNAKDFSDAYNLLYGHHMANSNMFGDLDLYADEAFFRSNQTGMLITEYGVYDLEVIAFLSVNASQKVIFDVENIRGNAAEVLRFARENAVFLSDTFPVEEEDVKLLALSTCSSDYTDARTVILTRMRKR